MRKPNAVIFAALISVAVCPLAGLAEECPSAIVPVDELIDRSTRIALVSVDEPSETNPANTSAPGLVIDAETEKRKMTESTAIAGDRANPPIRIRTLKVEEDLKGRGNQTIYRPDMDTASPQHDFDAHRELSFWEDGTVGLVRLDENCRPQMNFERGKTYLLFEGPAHVKSAELIESEDDAWLAYVRERLGM